MTKEKLEQFIVLEEKSIKIDMIPIDTLVELFKELEWEHNEDKGDKNGWQVDFWEYFYKDDKEIQLSGSLYYGNYELKKL